MMSFTSVRSICTASLHVLAGPCRVLAWIAAVMLLTTILVPAVTAAETYTLEEQDGQAFLVSNTVQVKGALQTSLREGKAASLPLDVKATLVYYSRMLPPAGRDARNWRALRDYRQAESTIKVDDNTTSARLRESRNLVVAEGQQDGITFYSPKGAMEHGEWELLRMPGDVLATLPLLPRTAVEIGESWQPDSWVTQCLTGTEAVLKSDLTCTLDSVSGQVAKVSFKGTLEGAIDGAQTELELSGHYLFDLNRKLIKAVELTQKEKRSVGAVSPGMDVTATVKVERQPVSSPDTLADAALAAIPLDAAAEAMRFEFRSLWNVYFHYDRDWHIFHQSATVAVLRLLDKGSLIAQCNISPIPPAAPGGHTAEDQFQADIRESLGERLVEITKAEQLKTGDDRYLYRVTAEGRAGKIDMQWIFYLCAAPDGRQVSFVFAVEKGLIEKLDNRDLGIVSNVQFLTPAAPRPAAATPGSSRQ
ncbi:MAG: hypothetical protein KDA79_17200 [Planctomycetaceae bacterium]|nr:hypothetical protein [Planctomycetaceae bacterium]